jgi:hypothetical protein
MMESKAKVSKVSKKKGENFLLVKIPTDFLSHSAIRVYSCFVFSVMVVLTAVKTARCLSLHKLTAMISRGQLFCYIQS